MRVEQCAQILKSNLIWKGLKFLIAWSPAVRICLIIRGLGLGLLIVTGQPCHNEYCLQIVKTT